MAMNKMKKENPLLSDYPAGVVIKSPKIPTTKEEIKQAQKVNFEYLLSMHKYDTLRSCFVNIEGYGEIPFYWLEFERLRLNFYQQEIPLNKYAEGYLEGIKTEFKPYINRPENIRELVTEALVDKNIGFPFSYKNHDENSKFLDPNAFYEYGKNIGKQKKAWDIVLESKEFFKEFLSKVMGSHYLGVIGNIHDIVEEYSKAYDKAVSKPSESATTNTQTDIQQFVNDTLKCLNGKWLGKDDIMTNADFNRLVGYVNDIFKNGKAPQKVIAIAQTPAPTEFIRHTFYLLYKEHKKTLRSCRKLWIEFIQIAFEQFKTQTNITHDKNFKKFNGNYRQMV